MRVTHFDTIDLRLDASTLRELPNGHLEVDGRGARVGLYTYHDDKGAPFVELVPPETLFDADSLATIPGTDVTIRHPAAGLVTADNWRELSHGTWVSGWPSGDALGVRLRLKTDEAKAMIRDALAKGEPIELSPAYQVDVKVEPGTTEHGRHDGVQRGRVYNAIAILGPNEARGGPQCRLQLDGPVCAPAGCRVQSARIMRADARPPTMKKIKVSHKDGRTVELDAANLGWLKSAKLDAKTSKGDQIETATVTVTMEGEEPIELMLPKGMVEMMLESVGAGPAAAAPAAPEGMAEETSEETIAVESADSLDAKVRAYLDAKLDAAIKRNDAAAAKSEARRLEVTRHAAKLNVDAAAASGGWAQLAADAIAKARPDLADKARKWAADAARSPVAEGQLRATLELLADASTSTQADSSFVRTPPPAKADGVEPWNNGTPNKPKDTVH